MKGAIKERVELMPHEPTVSNSMEMIRTIAEDVYRTLGSGFSENVYDSAMQVALRLANVRYESQKVIELKYRDHYVGEGYTDLIVYLEEESVIVELKAIGSDLGTAEEQQLRNYLNILNIHRGMLINFRQPGRNGKETRVEIKDVWMA